MRGTNVLIEVFLIKQSVRDGCSAGAALLRNGEGQVRPDLLVSIVEVGLCDIQTELRAPLSAVVRALPGLALLTWRV